MLRQRLSELGISQTGLANKTGLTLKHINRVAQNAAPLSVDVAIRIEAAVPEISAEGLLIQQVRDQIAAYEGACLKCGRSKDCNMNNCSQDESECEHCWCHREDRGA